MASRCEKTSGLATTVTSAGAVRPRFRERQVLRAADLEAQQSYLIAARRRHNIGQHGWGIVQGLEIQGTPELMVQPGMAVDGYGRELIVTSPVTIPSSVFTELGNERLDVWLVYQLVDMDVPQPGSRSCGPGKNTRTREQITTVRLTPAPRLPTEVPREPIEVPDADLPFPPHRTPPDDPEMEWPVYLGTIREWIVPPYDPNSPRPYATLTGQVVTPASGLARMQIDAELQSEKRQFAIAGADTSGKLIERLGIDREGNTFITGNTTVKKTVEEEKRDKEQEELDTEEEKEEEEKFNLNRLRFEPTRVLNFLPLAATPAAAAPWQIYRTSVKEENTTIRQLRFEFFHPGDKGEPTSYRFAVGTRTGTVFSPCFSLSADCSLTIAGDLEIRGQLVEGPIQADLTDTRFGALVAQVWAAGTKVGEITATTGTIGGKVTNSSGAIMSGVNVVLSTPGVADKTVQSDIAGNYVALQIPVGDYTISAAAPGFDPTTVTEKLEPAQVRNIPLVLSPTPPPPTIQGNVIDTNGAAVPGATVEFTHTTSGVVSTVTTNDAGVFTSGPLTAGSYSVRLTAPGFTPQTVTATAGDVLNITLQPAPQPVTVIQGNVIDTNGAVVPGATIEFTNTTTGTVTTVTTDTSGIFNSGPLTPGSYSVRVTAPGFTPQTVTATAGNVLTITLQPLPTNIRGNVIDTNSAAVLNALVQFRNQTTTAFSQVTTDVDGNFNSGPLTAGAYEVRVIAPGFLDTIVAANLGDVLSITLQPNIP